MNKPQPATPRSKALWHWALYPCTLSLALLLQQSLLWLNQSTLICTYTPLLLAAILISVLEYKHPYRRIWHPNATDIRQDLLFMSVVQIALPKLIQFTLTLYCLIWLQKHHLQPNLWPHTAALSLQVILLLLVVEFFRYWLHRLLHENALLWRLHRIHHRPEKLYWLNVGRFHPLEKLLQLLLDTVPFVLLGVNESVFAVYFLLYALNGFFQHSNLPITLGPLNYLISGAELHRWHHASNLNIAKYNYGNNLILWDWIFGTFYWPRYQQVGSIGLNHPPKNEALAMPSLKARLLHYALKFNMAMLYWRYFRPLQQAAKQPKNAQWRALQRILKTQQGTQFGQDHGFQAIHSIEQFQHTVPVQSYETLRPYIDRQIQQQTREVTQQAPIMYAQTSGTTGRPKNIPVTPETLRQYRRNQNLLAYQQYRFNPKAFQGKIWAMSCAATEGHLAHNIPYGSASGLLYQNLPKFARNQYIVPHAVFSISDYDLRYRIILKLALVHNSITCLCAANPSTFLRLCTLLNEDRAYWVRHFAHLTEGEIAALPTDLVRLIQSKLVYRASRRQHVTQQLTQKNPLQFRDFWPHIQTLRTWTRGSCGIALSSFCATLPHHTEVVDLGYLSSEFTGTLTLDPEQAFGVPLLQDQFFEFVTQHAWEQQRPHFLGLHELQAGQAYYIFITNHAGLYRYCMNDIVQTGGYWQNTLTLAFVQKGHGVTTITGEKLYESQVISAVQTALQAHNLSSPFFIMLADPIHSRYQLYLEMTHPSIWPNGFNAGIERQLSAHNIEYAQKRQSQRLHPLQLIPIQQGSGEQYKRHCIQHGQREAQYKTIALQYRENMHFDFDALRLDIRRGDTDETA